MAKQTKAAKADRDEAIARLREWIKPGDTVYTILDHVSSSGMSRAIRVVLLDAADCKDYTSENPPRNVERVSVTHPNWAVGKALDLRHWKRQGREQDALVVGGCGMDMGFHLVYELSHVLYGASLHKDVYLQSAKTINKDGTGPLLTREGAPEGHVYVGGYACLGKGKCPSNYHVNHHDRIRCDGVRDESREEGDRMVRCWAPGGFFGRHDDIPADWPRRQIDIGDGKTIDGPMLHCLSGSDSDGKGYTICPSCNGDGYVDNPEGPERFDLTHTDGYALRHRWL